MMTTRVTLTVSSSACTVGMRDTAAVIHDTAAVMHGTAVS